jgi:hypothetical protein
METDQASQGIRLGLARAGGLAPVREPFAADRVLRREGDVRDRPARLVGLLADAAAQVVALLTRRVGADDEEVARRRLALVAGAGGEDEDVARRDVQRVALRAAERERRAAGDDAQHLVGVAVEVVEGEHAVGPRAAPPVAREQRAAGVGAAGRLVDAAVDEHRVVRVVDDEVAGRGPERLGLHGRRVPRAAQRYAARTAAAVTFTLPWASRRP